MHSCITLLVDHQYGHIPPLPVIERPADRGGEVRIWFHDDGEDRIVVVGCMRCLAGQFRQLADALEEASDRHAARPGAGRAPFSLGRVG